MLSCFEYNHGLWPTPSSLQIFLGLRPSTFPERALELPLLLRDLQPPRRCLQSLLELGLYSLVCVSSRPPSAGFLLWPYFKTSPAISSTSDDNCFRTGFDLRFRFGGSWGPSGSVSGPSGGVAVALRLQQPNPSPIGLRVRSECFVKTLCLELDENLGAPVQLRHVS